jgi:2-C-methyl-D-erythritol 4-phosphate cytidylyltransferase
LPPNDPRAVAIVLAAGSSIRMNGIDKLLYPLAGTPAINWSLRALDASPSVHGIVVVLAPDRRAETEAVINESPPAKLTATCDGGESRFHSVLNGLRAAGDGYEWALVHDGARPFLSGDVIERGLKAARSAGAAIAAVQATDSIKLCDDERCIVGDPPRTTVWLAQTPQISRFDTLLRSYEDMQSRFREFTDEASVLHAAGHETHVFQGSELNVKLTTPADLELAGYIADRWGEHPAKAGPGA